MSAISRRLRFEWLEDRQLLAKADIVFLVDESLSNEENPVKPWLRTVVTGDADGNGIAEMTPLASQLAINGVTDIRYGLVGFGEQSGGGGKGVRNEWHLNFCKVLDAN